MINHVLLTPEEVADLLRVTPGDVLGLLEQGALGGLPIAGSWKVRADSVEDFLREGLQRENLRVLEKAIQDPAHWPKALREFPDLVTTIEQGQHPPDSMGAFLKDVLRHNQRPEEGAQKMGTITLYHASGADDFEIAGPALDASEAKRVLFNARRLLTARGLTEAVKLLESAPFSMFPGTNHFGDDDFHVLLAEVALAEYEDFRLAREAKRQAARDLAQTIMEAGGPYIRFVAIRLHIVDPETWEVFICHASEDKEDVARPLYGHLTEGGIPCWIDEVEIGWGESIVAKIQEGLSRARYVLVVLSAQLLKKSWAQKELRTALTLEIESNRNIVLPLIVGDPQSVLASAPFLREKRYLVWGGDLIRVERELRALARKQASQAG